MLHRCVNAIRDEMAVSHHGFYGVSAVMAQKYGLPIKEVENFFKVKYPELYPWGDESE